MSAPRRRNQNRARLLTALVLGTAVVAGIAVMAFVARPDTGGLQPTGDTNAMGLPVVSTPGTATGVARAGGVEIEGAHRAMGRVPLNVSLQPTWTLRNTSQEPVTIGEPHAEVNKGCCPGPLTLTQQTIPPGGDATLTFDLAMHEGMDGWHDIDVHVPVGEELVTVNVTGDFQSEV